MKKFINFLKKSTVITAFCLLVTGSFVLPKLDLDSENENSCSTCAVGDPNNDERPIGAGGADQD